MGQRQNSRRKVQTPDVGMVQVAGSFPSGAQEDGTFPDSALTDGYVATPYTSAPNDAYGAGYKGVLRVTTGRYDIVMDRVYPELLHCSVSLHTATSKGLTAQLDSPAMVTTDPSSGEDVSVIKFRITDESGLDTDLEYEDRISFLCVFRNSSA